MKNIPITKPYFDEDEAKEAAAALASGWVALGPRVAEFEKAVAAYEGVGYGVATTSATTALHLLMVTSGFGPGQDVFVPSFTFVATANAVEYTGARAVLVDVSTKTYNIDMPKAEAYAAENYTEKDGFLFNKKTGNKLTGIVPVNEFGLCADIPAVAAFAEKHHLKVVEDSACAFGAKIGDTFESKFGFSSALSFHPRKSITTGEGGMVLTDDEKLAIRLRQLRAHSASASADARAKGKGYLLPDFNEIGFNYRMTDIQGGIGLAQMRKIGVITERKNKLAARYNKILPEMVPYLNIPYIPEGYTHIWQTYCCMVNLEKIGRKTVDEGYEFRIQLMDRLEQAGISTRQGTHAVHTLNVYREKYGYKHEDLPGAYACDRLSIAIPHYVELTEEDQNYVIDQLAKIGKELI